MDPQKIFSLVIASAAVLAIAGVVIVYLRGSVADATIKQLKENFAAVKESRDIEKARADDAERDFDRFKAETETEIALLKADGVRKDDQIKTLQEVVTNKAEIQKLLQAIDKHHVESMETLITIKAAVT